MDLPQNPFAAFITVIVCIFVAFYFWINRRLPPGPRERFPRAERTELKADLTEVQDAPPDTDITDLDNDEAIPSHHLLSVPVGIPFLASDPFASPTPHLACQELGKRYGNVFSFYVGAKLTVVLNDYAAIRAAFVDQGRIFSGRPDGFLFRKQFQGDDGKGHGIAFHEGDVHKTSRKFLLQTLKDLETRNSKFERDVLVETDYLGDVFVKHEGNPFNPRRALTNTVNSILCTLMFGERYDQTDPSLTQYLADVECAFVMGSQAGSMSYCSFLRFLPGQNKDKFRKVEDAAKRCRKFLREKLAERREAYGLSRRARRSSETRPQDYIDVFLHEQRNLQAAGTLESQPAFDDAELLQNLPVFFAVGMDPIVTTLEWLFLFLLHYPEVQKKIHKELNENIESDDFVGLQDRRKLRYLDAVIREAQRLGSVSLFGIMHSNTEETRLLGHRIPKRCAVVPNYYAVNTDPKRWEEPLAFRPERFLDSDGQVHEPPQFIPFSIGMRSCIGENVARLMLFMIFANIMQRFEILTADPAKLTCTDQNIVGLSSRPLPFDMTVEVRANSKDTPNNT